MSQERRAAVLGHPVGHSLSPVLHRAAYEALGLTGWRYDALDVTEDQLADVVGALDGTWTGLSLTMPLKQTVLRLLDHVEPLAETVGAVNTVLVQPVGRTLSLTGANTDVHGIVAALREGFAAAGRDLPAAPSAAVLGAGATAASTLAALGELGCTAPTVYVRAVGRSGPLQRAAHRMGVSPVVRTLDRAGAEIGGADIVVSTLPAGAADAVAGALVAPAQGVLLDVVYAPARTGLIAAWETAGGVAVGGARMLLHQAAEQVRLMTGRPAPLDAMDAALRDALAASV
ncbi:shikimate dehydrogenase [Cellulomonas sp. SG140]|uniref:shikimate dehydrogenase n=1 Tax=Cellulomonas sp. SG140 TaxID=2976536 RepID=UPI0021E8DCC6|nr:shikimate dehydrogenase [Cellulomonas sp. SG140]